MKEIEFNLLDEPWIRVRDDSCQVHEVSLTDALLHAHQYTSLSGELPTQDIVILRLMLAVLHTVFPESMRTAMRQNWKTKKKRLRGGQIFGNLVSFRRNRFSNIWKMARTVLAVSSGKTFWTGGRAGFTVI